MKVRVIQKPTYQYGGARYDPLQYSVQDVLGMGVGTLQTGLGIDNIIQSLSPDKKQNPTPAQTGTSSLLSNWKGLNNNPTINSGVLSGYKGLNTTPAPKTGILSGYKGGLQTRQEGGEAQPTDPQLLAAYKSIVASLEQGVDPYSIIDEFVNAGMAQDDAQALVAQVMEYLNPTAEASMPQAQMGGTQSGMNAGINAGQSQGAYIVKKPLMKDGGQTFVTSQPAYTKKSHTYFGTSNAPARDSYVDNNQITTSVKAVPREDATIEAEKGEYIFSNAGLYKIEGKKHYEGGTPLAAKGGEFIFSAHRDMSLDPKLLKEAGLKVSPSKALADHVPAKVLERNIDVKEYNRLKTILSNPKSDPVTKKTAQFMLDKMHNKIDVIAKLQEGKKQPKPVQVEDQYLEQSEVEKDINEQKQYAYGGLTKYQEAGNVDSTEVKVSDVNFSGTNNMQDLNRIIRIVDKSGNQEVLNLMKSEDLQRYSQMYLYLGDGVHDGTEPNSGAEMYTYPLMDEIQPNRVKTYNLPTVKIEGAIDPRWADFVANNQQYLEMMTPAEKEQMKRMVLGQDVNERSTGYWDRAGADWTTMKVRKDHDPRIDIDAEKLIPFWGRKSEGFGDWLGTLFSMPQKEMNKLLTGYFETPAETANRLHVEDKDWEKKGFWTNLLTDPMLAESSAKVFSRIGKIANPKLFGKFVTAAEKKAALATADEAFEEYYKVSGRESASRIKLRQINKTLKSLEEQIAKETDKKTIEYLNAQKTSLEKWKALAESQKNWAKEATKTARKTAIELDKPNYSKYLFPGTRRLVTTYVSEPLGHGLGVGVAYAPHILKPEMIRRALNAIGRGVYNVATHPEFYNTVLPASKGVGAIARHSSDEKRNKAILDNRNTTVDNLVKNFYSTISDPSGNISTSDTTQVAGPSSDSTQQAAPPPPPVQQQAPVGTAPVRVQNVAPSEEQVARVEEYPVRDSNGDIDPTKVAKVYLSKTGKVIKREVIDKKQFGGYFAYGGLNQYQSGTANAQPTYYNNPKTGLRVDFNTADYTDPTNKITYRKGEPALYKGNQRIYTTYYNPNDNSPTGANSGYGSGLKLDTPQKRAEYLSKLIQSYEDVGIDLSSINNASDFQQAIYDYKLNNDPQGIIDTYSVFGSTNKMEADPNIQKQLAALGVKISPNSEGYGLDFSAIKDDPAKVRQALLLMQPGNADNIIGARSLYVKKKPVQTTPNPSSPTQVITTPNPSSPTQVITIPNPSSPTHFDTIPIDGSDFDIQDPYAEVGAWQTAQYFNAMRKPRFTYTPPIEQPNTIFTPMSRQPFEDEAGRSRYSANQLASKFGDMTGRQMAAAQQNEQINKGLFGVEKFNTEGYNQNFNENLLRDAAKVNQFNQMAKTVHDQNNLAQDKTDEANAFAFNQYAAAREKDPLNRWYAYRDLQAAMLPYGSTYNTVDAYGRPTRRIAYPVYPSGRLNRNWNGWNTNATNQLAGGNDINKLLTEIDNSGLPADKKLELKIKALRGDKS